MKRGREFPHPYACRPGAAAHPGPGILPKRPSSGRPALGVAGIRSEGARFSLSILEATHLSTNEREKRVRVNRMIRISPVRVIGPGGEQLGVLPVEEALAAAQERGLDLVEVAPTARPPVVKIMDYGKFKFEEAKAARAAKKKQHIIQLKEVKYRPGIDDHDFEFKTRHAREFLGDGNKVKVTMMYRGRQIAHLELGKAVLDRVAASLADIGKIESEAKLEGRNMTMVIAPK